MEKHDGISRYKLNRIAVEALRNCIRLHFDSILLFDNDSHPSAFQLSVLSLEEFAKAKWLEHYIWSSETNDGYPEAELEDKWMADLYRHPYKQLTFIAREIFDFSPKFAEFVKSRQLEVKKQNATYVGLSRSKGKIVSSSRVSTPDRISSKDAKQMISLINSELVDVCRQISEQDMYFDIPEMDDVLNDITYMKLLKWPYNTGLKSKKWLKVWFPK
jgi:AbiV family abortive infection protein